jgi:hypothetical protein
MQGGDDLKFAAKYFDPFKIKRILRDHRYIVEKIDQTNNFRMKMCFHSNRSHEALE